MHIQLNTRQREILLILLQANGFITVSEIARQLYLSSRSVRYNLPKIKLWLEDKNIEFISKRGLGLYIDLIKSQKSQLVLDLNRTRQEKFYITPERRARIIFLEILLSEDRLSIKDISNLLGISRTTVHNTLLKISEIANEYNLQFKKDRKEGLKLEGEERHLRYALSEKLFEEINFSTWKELWIKEGNIAAPPYLFETTNELLKDLKFTFAKKMVLRFEQGLGHEFTISSRFFLTIFIAVSIHRINKGHICNSIPSNILNFDCFPQGSGFLKTKLFEVVKKELPPSEIETIKSLFYCFGPQSVSNSIQTKRHPRFVTAASEVISDIAFYLHPSLKIDNKLEKDLTDHFSQLYFKLFLEYPINNPYLTNIQSIYPDIYKIAVQALKVLKQKFRIEIPSKEAAHLALLFAGALSRLKGSKKNVHNCLVICEEPFPIRVHLFSCLINEFPDLNFLEADNDPSIFMKQMEEVQLVISTSIIEANQKPVIQIKPIPIEEDWEAIRKWKIDNEFESEPINLEGTDKLSILDIIKRDSITIHKKVSNWKDTISLVGKPLVQKGHITNNYLRSVEEILQTYGPFCYIAPNVILLHAKPTDGAISLSLSVLILKKGVDFGNKSLDPVDIIFLLAASDEYSHIYALGQLIALSKNRLFLNEIRSAQNSQDIVSILWNYSASDQNTQL